MQLGSDWIGQIVEPGLGALCWGPFVALASGQRMAARHTNPILDPRSTTAGREFLAGLWPRNSAACGQRRRIGTQ